MSDPNEPTEPARDREESYSRATLPPVWVVYEHPTDYPASFVVRVFWGLTPSPEAHEFRTLAEARAHVAREGGAVRMERSDKDPNVIREAWI